jgi:hypothetical protein
VEVKSNGTIDESCEGKLQWDRDLRLAVPRFLDVSIISLENQNPQEMNNLRVYMEAKYKYVNHSVSDSGFNDCVLHQLNSERARLKQLYFGPTKQITCPKNAHPVAWRKLKAHWQDEEIRRKAQMKTGSEAQAVPLHLLKAQLVSPPCLPPLCHFMSYGTISYLLRYTTLIRLLFLIRHLYLSGMWLAVAPRMVTALLNFRIFVNQ